MTSKRKDNNTWHDKTDAERAEEYEALAEQTLPGYSRDTYLRYAAVYRQRAEGWEE